MQPFGGENPPILLQLYHSRVSEKTPVKYGDLFVKNVQNRPAQRLLKNCGRQ